MKLNVFIGLALVGLLFSCTTPTNPNDPKNAKAEIVLTGSNGTSNPTAITDTVGFKVILNVTTTVPSQIDSIRVRVSGNNAYDLDTLLTTIIYKHDIEMIFNTEGLRVVSLLMYAKGNLVTDEATISIVKKVAKIIGQQSNVSIPEGDSALLYVLLSDQNPSSIRWYKNGALFPSTGDDTLRLKHTVLDDSGYYLCVVTYSKGIPDSSLPIHVSVIQQHPNALTITKQPTSKIIATAGSSNSISISATGSLPILYQWFKNNVTMAEKTDTNLVFSSIALSDSGIYTCKVTDALDSQRVSAPCTLKVVSNPVAPSITANLQDTTVLQGTALTLNIGANGTDLNYQWYKDKQPIQGQTSNNLSFKTVQLSDSGTYYVSFSNSLGTIYSDTIKVTVIQSTFTFNIINSGHGKVSPSEPIISVQKGTSQTFSFAPDSGYQIKEVRVDGTAIDSVKISKKIIFENVQESHTITVLFDQVVMYTLNKTFDTTQGIINLSPAGGYYPAGTVVTITANALDNKVFKQWGGDLTGNTNPTTITMNSNKSVSALFESDTSAKTVPLTPGVSLNTEIKKASVNPASLVVIAPAPGKYDSNSLEVRGTVTVRIKKR